MKKAKRESAPTWGANDPRQYRTDWARPIEASTGEIAFTARSASAATDAKPTSESTVLRKVAAKLLALAAELEREAEYTRTEMHSPEDGHRAYGWACLTLRAHDPERYQLLEAAHRAATKPTPPIELSLREHVRQCWYAVAYAIVFGEETMGKLPLSQLTVGLAIMARGSDGSKGYIPDLEKYLRSQDFKFPKTGWKENAYDTVATLRESNDKLYQKKELK